MDDAEDHAKAIREMWMQEVHMNEDGGGDGNDYAFDPGEKSSGYRRRMAGERTGMHEVGGPQSATSGGSNRTGSSAYRRRMAEEADEENKEQIWRDEMEEEGEAIEKGIKANQEDIKANKDLTDRTLNLMRKTLAGALARIEEIEGKGEPFVRWTPDVEEDAFLCVYPGDTDGSTTVLVNHGDCYVDGVAVTTGDHLFDQTLTVGSGVIYMKYVISTDTWTGPTFADARQTHYDDIRYFYLAEMEFDDGAIAGIKPLHRGDIHFFTSASGGDADTVSGIEPFFAKFESDGINWNEVSMNAAQAWINVPAPAARSGAIGTDTTEMNGNTKAIPGIVGPMWATGNTLHAYNEFVFIQPIPYMDQYEVITALADGVPEVTNVRVSST